MIRLAPVALLALSVVGLVAYSERDAFAVLTPTPQATYSLVQYVEQGGEVHAYVDDYGMSADDCLTQAQARDDLRCEAEEVAL